MDMMEEKEQDPDFEFGDGDGEGEGDGDGNGTGTLTVRRPHAPMPPLDVACCSGRCSESVAAVVESLFLGRLCGAGAATCVVCCAAKRHCNESRK